jgi:hypothetical protein
MPADPMGTGNLRANKYGRINPMDGRKEKTAALMVRTLKIHGGVKVTTDRTFWV